jgi:tetratricopeptide (TPR) repeat protein
VFAAQATPAAYRFREDPVVHSPQVTTRPDELVEDALARYRSGDLAGCREAALAGLRDHPEDATLLRLAGKTSVELEVDGGAEYLREAVRVEPGNAEAWRDLADALVDDERLDEAVEALRRTVELRPDDIPSHVQLGNVLYAGGAGDEAVATLEQALERKPGDLAALRSLVAVCRATGRRERALAAARNILSLTLDDIDAALDVAELSLELEQFEEASDAFRWLRDIDDEPEHEVYAYHGMIDAQIRREAWRRALDLAVEATRVDRYGRTTDLLAYVVSQVFGGDAAGAPSRRDVDDALRASREEHRRLHTGVVL